MQLSRLGSVTLPQDTQSSWGQQDSWECWNKHSSPISPHSRELSADKADPCIRKVLEHRPPVLWMEEAATWGLRPAPPPPGSYLLSLSSR